MNTDISLIYHLGAPYTDNDHMTWSIRKDNELMAQHGVMMRRPKEYRPHIKKMLGELKGEEPSIVDQENLMAALVRNQPVDRYIMSDNSYLGSPVWAFSGGMFYQNAGKNTAALRNLFPDNPCEFFLGISNLASFIPAAFEDQDKKDYENFIGGADLNSLRWADVIHSIKEANPDCPITVWCNEDTPIIWPTILREITALDPLTRLQGELDIMRSIMSEDSIDLLVKYLDERPNLTEIQRRRIRAIFLEKFALDDEVEEEIDLPGWTEETIDMLSENYEEDIEEIGRISGVNLISS